MKRVFSFLAISSLLLSSCSVQKKIDRSAKADVLQNKALMSAHVGISIYEPATGKYYYNHQGDKYFVPASNTKLATCYSAMKYLGDSLEGLRYYLTAGPDPVIVVDPLADPTFLHPDFSRQPVMDFLKNHLTGGGTRWQILDTAWQDSRWGSGWSWNDYEAYYMAERSAFPVYGNTIHIKLEKDQQGGWSYHTGSFYFDSILLVNSGSSAESIRMGNNLSLERDIAANHFIPGKALAAGREQEISFFTNGVLTSAEILGKEFANYPTLSREGKLMERNVSWTIIHSQPTDSMLKRMMHRSDNFYAEQSLLMVSKAKLGIMNDEKITDYILSNDFKDLPQRPNWADGSGLSRYNLFTPQDFVAILNKMKNEFGMDRLKTIMATGGEGTISSYYKDEKGFIYAKTGTLSGVVALSGFLYTKRKRLLIFSVLVNNHMSSTTDVRRAVEKFIKEIRNDY